MGNARDGITFSEDALLICDSLRKGLDSVDTLTQYIADLLGFAKNAHHGAQYTSEKFRDVRQGLFEVNIMITSFGGSTYELNR